MYLAYLALALGLLAAAFIDAEHMILPDSVTLGGTVVGVVTATLRGVSSMERASASIPDTRKTARTVLLKLGSPAIVHPRDLRSDRLLGIDFEVRLFSKAA